MRRPETIDRKPSRGLAQPVPGAAGTFTGLWGEQSETFGGEALDGT